MSMLALQTIPEKKNISSDYSNGCTDNYVDVTLTYLKKKHFSVIKHFTATDDK